MRDNYTDIDGLKCPHCGAINHPNTLICNGCGVRLDIYDDVIENIREQKAEKEYKHQQQLINSGNEAAKRESGDSRLMAMQLLKYLALVFPVLVVVFIASGALLGKLERIRREQVLADYNLGKNCLAQENFLCARNAFYKVSLQKSDFPDVLELLSQARIGLAHTYVNANQVAKALEELDILLIENPDDPEIVKWTTELHVHIAEEYARSSRYQEAISHLETALAYQDINEKLYDRIKEYYDDWYQYERDHGSRFSAWVVRLRSDLRFR